MTFITRKAVPSDLEAIVQFNIDHAKEIENKVLDRGTLTEGVKAVLSGNAHSNYFVTLDGDEQVGCIMNTHEWSDWRNGDLWWIQSVFVKPSHRQNGVFKALLATVEQECIKAGGIGVRLYYEQDNLKAKNCYTSLGFAECGYSVMHKNTNGEKNEYEK